MSVPTAIAVARARVRPHAGAVVQTAVAALAAWGVAGALLAVAQPAFASIAAIVCLGVAHGERRRRALELTGGVLLGLTVASGLLAMLGTGVPQVGLLVVLAMSAALLLRGGEMVVTEAAVSAVLLASFPAGSAGFLTADRLLEGLIGGAVALVVAAVVLPPDPVLLAGRVAHGLFGRLGSALE